MRYDIGDVIRVSIAFTNAAGAAADPTNVYAKYKAPSGAITTLTYGVDGALAKDSTGNYHTDIQVDETGTWWARFYSTGTNKAAAEDSFIVRDSNF